MNKLIPSLLLALCVALPVQHALAQTMPTSMAAGDSLYKALGEKPGLVKLMDDFMPRLVADARTGPFFKPANQQRIKEQLVEQFCQVSGGPCVYQGADMKTAHGNLDINKSQFNALVELLQQSMDAQGIAFANQNKLLAQLAPMNRDVITVK
jgi:hemoglobin